MTPILLDGPMGTEIERRGGEISIPLWSAKGLIDNPDMIKQIHIDYIKAGANVITTNTFRTQERTFEKVGLNDYGQSMTELAVELAIDAKKVSNPNILVAGSISPLEDCYSPVLVPQIAELKTEHADMADWLFNSGVDLFLIETMNSIKEAKVVMDITKQYEIPTWLGMTVSNEGNLLSGETWVDLLKSLDNFPDVLFVNCSSRIGTEIAIEEIIRLQTQSIPNFQFGFYPNYLFELEKGKEITKIRAEFYESLDLWLVHNPSVIGTCCGARPEDTKYLKKLVDRNS